MFPAITEDLVDLVSLGGAERHSIQFVVWKVCRKLQLFDPFTAGA